jgi:L-fucose isomerase-like protein
MKRFTVGAIGARTTAFKTIRFDELALQKIGITVETLDLSELLYRVRAKTIDSLDVRMKRERLTGYTDFSKVPSQKLDMLCRLSCAIDDIICDNALDVIALRCWDELEKELGVTPCVLLSELNDRGIPAACELDVGNAVAMQALMLASQEPSTCLDWNNNYGDDPDKCILFHCGPVPQSLMTGCGEVTDHRMFAKTYGAGCGWGCNEGRIGAFPMTFLTAKTENGEVVFISGEGEFTEDIIEDGFFGCGGVARIEGLQKTLLTIGRNGFRHHVGVTRGHVVESIREAFSSYLGYRMIVN